MTWPSGIPYNTRSSVQMAVTLFQLKFCNYKPQQWFVIRTTKTLVKYSNRAHTEQPLNHLMVDDIALPAINYNQRQSFTLSVDCI